MADPRGEFHVVAINPNLDLMHVMHIEKSRAGDAFTVINDSVKVCSAPYGSGRSSRGEDACRGSSFSYDIERSELKLFIGEGSDHMWARFRYTCY